MPTITETVTRVPHGNAEIPTHLFHPAAGSSPAVLLLMDGPGIREELKDVARRLAAAGFYVALPDLYYRFGDYEPVSIERIAARDHDEIARVLAMIDSIDDDAVLEEIATIVRHVRQDPGVAPGPLGCMGFCIGARFSLQAMGTMPDDVVGAAVLHVSFQGVEDVPDPIRTDGIRGGAIYIAHGEADTLTPVEAIADLVSRLKESPAELEVAIHPGADHGYLFRSHAGFAEAAAERDWERIVDLFDRQLRTGAAR